MRKILIIITLILIHQNLLAKIQVMTTISDLASITNEVGKDLVEVSSIAKGTQDPHFIEAKPSFMTKLNRADLLISIGLDLETGWLPLLIQGAKNPKVTRGQKGFLEIGPMLEPIEISQTTVSRSEGDVHPFGNPHITLDPIRVGKAALIIAERLAELDSTNASEYQKNAKEFSERLEKKTLDWKKRLETSNVKKIITYHRTLSYFLDRFGIKSPVVLEPKPGIPPTSTHIMSVIELMKKEKINIILVENFFDPTVTKKIKDEIPNLKVAVVAVNVGGAPDVNIIDDLFENLVKQIEGK